MVANKISRVLNGDPDFLDSWHDIAGYITLVVKELQEKEKVDGWKPKHPINGGGVEDTGRCGYAASTGFPDKDCDEYVDKLAKQAVDARTRRFP